MLENFPGSIKKQSKELKSTHTQKKYFIFQKDAIYAGAGTLQSPCYLNLVPRALFTGFGGGALSQRFGHPLLILLQRFGHPSVPSRDAQIPSVLVIPSKTILDFAGKAKTF